MKQLSYNNTLKCVPAKKTASTRRANARCLAKRYNSRNNMFNNCKMLVIILLITTQIYGCGAESKAQNESVEDETIELIRGNQPISGNYGNKRIVTISNEEELASQWFSYTSEELPIIDFENHIVILWDRGPMNINNCGSFSYFSNVTAVKINESMSLTSVNLVKSCPNPEVSCTAEDITGSPFVFVTIPRSREMFVAENIMVDQCN